MKKIIIFVFLLGLVLALPPALAPKNATTTDRFYVNYGFYRGNDTECYSRYPCFANGTACDPYVEPFCYACSLEGKSYGGQAISPAPACFEYFEIYNVERANFNLLIKMIPFPQVDCFTNNTNCPIAGWNTVGKLRMGDTYAEADMAGCWNWWNSSDTGVQDEQAEYCPTASLYITGDAVRRRIYVEWRSGSGAQVSYAPVVLGYSTSIVNVEERVSPTLRSLASATLEFVEININVWRILYYLFIILSLIIGIIALVGILPLSIKWIIKKVTD